MAVPANQTRLYLYDRCDTCRKAVRFMESRGLPYTRISIREQPPGMEELQRMLRITGSLRRLFNTSGRDYKDMELAARLPGLDKSEALSLLATQGNLVKRPFLLLADGRGTVGFKLEEWEALFPVAAQ